MIHRKLRENERRNDIAEVIITALVAGPMTRKALYRTAHESPARIYVNEFVRELNSMRRAKIVRFSGTVEPGQLIELTPEWR